MNLATRKSAKRAMLAVLLLMLCHCAQQDCSASQAGTKDASIVANGGFESASAGLPSGWNLDQSVANKGSVVLDRSKGHNGGIALVLRPNTRNQPGPQPFALGQVIKVDSLRGRNLRVSAWLGAKNGATAVLGVYLIRKGGGQPRFVQLRQASNQGHLVRSEDALSVPSGNDVELMILFAAVEGTSGTAYFDDIVISDTDEPRASPPDERTGIELEAQVTVLANRKVRDIPRTLFGTNIEWINNGNSIWNTKTNQLEPEIVALAKQMNISRIRFGSDSYHWRDGIGPQSARPTTRNFAHGGGASSRHSFGTDEALAFAKLIGANLHILVNVGTGTPSEAADWVRYINGKDKPADQHVEFWEVGNELYMKNDTSGGMPPKEYAKRFLEFAQAMKAVDPSIKLAAIGGENFGRYKFVSYPNWNKTVLKRAADRMDYLAVHNAYAPVLVDDKKLDPVAVYKAMLAAPLLIKRNLETISKQIDRFAGDSASRIKIAVTEWGPLFHALPSNPYVDHVKTLGSALYVASTLKVLVESPRTEVANFFKLTELSFMGWIGKRGNGYVPTAPYYAYQMFRERFGKVVVESRVVSPTYDTPGAGTVAAVDNVPYFEIVSAKSNDGKLLYLIGINKHFDHPVRAAISLQGFTPGTRAATWTLHGTGPDAHTGTELPPLPPGWSWSKQAELEPYRRFHAGGPGEVRMDSKTFDDAAAEFTYTFPPCSVTSIELRKSE